MMKSRNKWRRIDVDKETKILLEKPIIDSSQLQIESNDAYSIDLDGDDYNVSNHNRINKLQKNGIKHVNKSQNVVKSSKKSLKNAFEMTRIKKMAKNILSKNHNNINSNKSSQLSNSTNDISITDVFTDDIKHIHVNGDVHPTFVPFGGQSYNPSVEDHHNHLLIASEQIEMENRSKHESDPDNYLKPMTATLKEMLPHLEVDTLEFKTKQRLLFILNQTDISNKIDLINECIANDGIETDEMGDPVISAMPRSKRALKRKTQADRNKKERAKIIKLDDKERQRVKMINRGIDELDEIIRQCDEEEKKREEKRKGKELSKKISLIMKKKGLLRLKHSNKRYWPQSVKDIALIDELPSCLRHVKPISGVKIVQNQLIEKGLINLPPEIDKQYESRIKYDIFVKENAAKLVDRTREIKNTKKHPKTDHLQPEKDHQQTKITSLI